MAESEEKKRVLSPALIGFLRRRLMELTGLVLFLLGVALTATLFSPGRYDPPFSAFRQVLSTTGLAPGGHCRCPSGQPRHSRIRDLVACGLGIPAFANSRLASTAPVSGTGGVAEPCRGLYGLSGGDGSAAGGAAGVVLIGPTQPYLPAIPPVLGLTPAHYAGAGFLIVGILLCPERHCFTAPVGRVACAGGDAFAHPCQGCRIAAGQW